MHRVPPLIVGTTPILAAKIRLLGKSASCIDVITGERDLPADFQLPGVRLLEGQSVRTAHRQFRGRPLIVIDCGDEKLNASLAGRALALGVPVNVPDKPTLCSFYFGSIVDRAPVTIAISTAGLAPVLGQHLRAWMEDRLPAGYGRLALYLNRLRDRLHHLPAAHRRALLRRAAGGAGAALAIKGDDPAADMQLFAKKPLRPAPAMPRSSVPRSLTCGDMQVWIVDIGTGDPELLSRRAASIVRNADMIINAGGPAEAILDLARREADITILSKDKAASLPASVLTSMFAAVRRSAVVVVLTSSAAEKIGTAITAFGGDEAAVDILFPAAVERAHHASVTHYRPALTLVAGDRT